MSERPPRKRTASSTRLKKAKVVATGCPTFSPLGQLEHYVLYLDMPCRLFVAQRTSARFERLEDIESCFGEIDRLLSHIERRRYRLLVDTRTGPSRNDERFEAKLKEQRGKLLLGFAKNAALALTAAGRLQIQRFAKADGREVFATDDPVAAFQYLGVPGHQLHQLPSQ